MFKNLVILFVIVFSFGACSILGGDTGGDSGGGTGGGGSTCNQAKECRQVTEENKPEVTAWAGRSCKVGDWVGQGDSTCSSTEAKCKCK